MVDDVSTSKDSKYQSIILKDDVLFHLKKSFSNEKRVSILGENSCEDYFQRLMFILTIPPSYTVIRMNHLHDNDDRPNTLIKTLNENLMSYQEKRLSKLFPPFLHPVLSDTAVIRNEGPVEGIEKLQSEIIVDHTCGMSVLRGSEIFVQGILGAPVSLKRGDFVSVYADLDGCCLRGQTRPTQGKKLFLGNGEAAINREELFRNSKNSHNENHSSCSSSLSLSGVGVKMTNALYSAPRLDILNKELFFAQNLPSIVCSYVLNPQLNETILDMCAAPGGKTIHIATLMKNCGRVVALDRTLPKIQRVASLISNWKITCVESYLFDSTKALRDDAGVSGQPPYPPETFDRILLDAPCSALGQRPTYRNNMTLSNLKSYPSYQRKLITQAVRLLKLGGILVFSTCTITLEENENQVAWILQTFPELSLSSQTPHLGGTGLPGSLLTERQQKLVQRFDPVSVLDDDESKNYDRDTIGFFIAKFIKSEK